MKSPKYENITQARETIVREKRGEREVKREERDNKEREGDRPRLGLVVAWFMAQERGRPRERKKRENRLEWDREWDREEKEKKDLEGTAERERIEKEGWRVGHDQVKWCAGRAWPRDGQPELASGSGRKEEGERWRVRRKVERDGEKERRKERKIEWEGGSEGGGRASGQLIEGKSRTKNICFEIKS